MGNVTNTRLDYQPLFGRGAPPRSHGWTREDSFVSLSQSDNRPQIFVGHKSVHKLSRQNTVNKMADGLELMALARKRILETFHIESLKDLQREALEKLICGRNVFLIQRTGSGKSDFSIRSDILRHREAEICEVDSPCDFSSGFSYVRPSSLSKISRDKCGDHWRRTEM